MKDLNEKRKGENPNPRKRVKAKNRLPLKHPEMDDAEYLAYLAMKLLDISGGNSGIDAGDKQRLFSISHRLASLTGR